MRFSFGAEKISCYYELDLYYLKPSCEADFGAPMNHKAGITSRILLQP